MSNQPYIAPGGSTAYRKSDGSGTDVDPFVAYFREDALRTAHGTPADLPANTATLTTTPATAYSEIQLLKALVLGQSTGTVAATYAECTSGTTAITITTTLTTVITVDVRGWKRLNLQIQNLGATALNAFSVQGRYNSGLGSFYNPRAAATADFTTGRALQTGNATAFVFDASADLTVLAATTSGWIELNVEKYESIRIQARVATGTTTMRIDGVAK